MRRTFMLTALITLAAFFTACDNTDNANNGNVTTNSSTNINSANTTTTDTNSTNTTITTNANVTSSNVRMSNRNSSNTSNANTTRLNPVHTTTDQITVRYPTLFLQNDEAEDAGRVTFELAEVAGRVSPTTTINGNTTIRRDRPGHIEGAQAGMLRPEADLNKYDVYVEVKLFTEGFTKIDPPKLKRLYTGQKEVWEWKLKPAGGISEGTNIYFQFQVNVTWQAKSPDVSTREISDVWSNSFWGEVGPPASRVNAALYSSPVVGACGVIAFGASFRKRRELMDEGSEEDAAAESAPAGAKSMEFEEEAATAEEDDEVSGTVYAPGQASPGEGFLVQVYIHLPEQAAALDELAREADEDAKRRISSRLQKKIKRGTELTLNLQMPGLVVDEEVQTCVWEGEPTCVQFGVTVPEDCKPKNIFGTVIVSENTVPIGHLKFKFKITGEAQAANVDPAAIASMTRYHQAFISYASQDRQEVLKRVQMLNLAHINFFQDLLTLEPGDKWEKLLYDYIDKSDVFYLFWSKAASEAQWVKKEVEYAIKRRNNQEMPEPEIIPVIIEGPPPAKPPAELSSLHFNDKLIYFINTIETQNKAS